MDSALLSLVAPPPPPPQATRKDAATSAAGDVNRKRGIDEVMTAGPVEEGMGYVAAQAMAPGRAARARSADLARYGIGFGWPGDGVSGKP
jgi:hypothetical protein